MGSLTSKMHKAQTSKAPMCLSVQDYE